VLPQRRGRTLDTCDIPAGLEPFDKEVQLRDGTTRLFRVHAVDGAAAIVELEVTGEPHAVSLERGRIRPFEAAEGGSVRWYGTHEVPETFGGGGTLTLRLDQTRKTEGGDSTGLRC
jgi:hypothetical protein